MKAARSILVNMTDNLSEYSEGVLPSSETGNDHIALSDIHGKLRTGIDRLKGSANQSLPLSEISSISDIPLPVLSALVALHRLRSDESKYYVTQVIRALNDAAKEEVELEDQVAA